MPSFLDNWEESLSSFLEMENGSMNSAKTKMARFMPAAYASQFYSMYGMQPSQWFVTYSPLLLQVLQLQPDFWRSFLFEGFDILSKRLKV